MPDSEQLDFRPSSYSNGGGGCVERAVHASGVTVRDSKDPEGPRIEFTHQEWMHFLDELMNDRPCLNGVVTISTEEQEGVYGGETKLTCWNFHATRSEVVLRFTAAEKDAFLLGLAAGEFHLADTTAELAVSRA
ncbi:hypothetical protein SUDANB95_07899 (plasmid) [Actinosynnema sp. ALI-1.44]